MPHLFPRQQFYCKPESKLQNKGPDWLSIRLVILHDRELQLSVVNSSSCYLNRGLIMYARPIQWRHDALEITSATSSIASRRPTLTI